MIETKQLWLAIKKKVAVNEKLRCLSVQKFSMTSFVGVYIFLDIKLFNYIHKCSLLTHTDETKFAF